METYTCKVKRRSINVFNFSTEDEDHTRRKINSAVYNPKNRLSKQNRQHKITTKNLKKEKNKFQRTNGFVCLRQTDYYVDHFCCCIFFAIT